MTENGLFVLGGPETHPHDILWAVHDVKIVVEVRARKFSGSSRLRWVVGDERCSVVCVFLSYAGVCARRSLTEPERLRCLLTEPERSIALALHVLNTSDRSLALRTELDRSLR